MTTVIIEHAEFDRVAVCTEHPGAGLAEARHHPDGCQGARTTEHRSGWHTRVGTPIELADRTPCLTCASHLGIDLAVHPGWVQRSQRPWVMRARS